MHAPLLSPLQKRLLDGWQRDLPLVARPFAAIADMLGHDEAAVIAASRDLLARGIVARIGPVVRPNTAGASTLACQRAMSSPASSPRWRRPETSITSCVRQNLSIASATKPCDHDFRARSIWATRSPPALSASLRMRA